MATHVPEIRPAPRLRHPRVVLDDHLPVDHGLSKVYRIGAGLMGLVLVAFGILGLIDQIGFFDTGGDKVTGLNTNGALSVLSILFGALLFVGMVIGRNVASTINMTVGILFILSGFVNLALLQTDYNFLAFKIQNVLFSFVVGVMLMAFGMYGRVSGTLPHDNPYWRARHPVTAAHEDRARAARHPHPTLEATKAPGATEVSGATETTKITDGPGPPRIIDK
ncbi:DUF4383 domain-containing protein [Streptomyces sp. NBC_01003]|uniref:DUF4383 domain-containing protein n=1 Tax=Streptomyces sp. NBC_01003 TaxID=2903714 RepID=UPI00386B72B1|nr:DUF4383 domain-containing protein [Streptomyces sp. NBC_01003]